ncbi:MAG: Zn-dependent protease [Candidatus Marinimicrobia bacterium CG08_land_8_20_14_0_20_45_22]|nr:MAG: Zn-dependent protease [Candidatus Marinimicrobia bacterium CG08_land_8_20_14_0_20_45_22]
MKSLQAFLITILFSVILAAGETATRPVATYSIVAYDEMTGELGVAVQSHWFSVGQLVPWAKAGVGAVATQSFVKVEYGPDGLALMEKGLSAEKALKKLLENDKDSAVRQVAMIDVKGFVSAYTGSRCVNMAGHHIGKNYSVQANMMENNTVWDAMAKAFETAPGDLADRMMSALEAAEKEGGDIRGRQSAAMLIVSGKPTGIPWKDIVLNLRVEDNPDPLSELKRLIRIHRAYQHANQGDAYLEKNEIEKALNEYRLSENFYPENAELPYWTAITLVSTGRIDQALPIFHRVFQQNPNLKKMTPRLVNSGLLPNDAKLIEKIMTQ